MASPDSDSDEDIGHIRIVASALHNGFSPAPLPPLKAKVEGVGGTAASSAAAGSPVTPLSATNSPLPPLPPEASSQLDSIDKAPLPASQLEGDQRPLPAPPPRRSPSPPSSAQPNTMTMSSSRSNASASGGSVNGDSLPSQQTQMNLPMTPIRGGSPPNRLASAQGTPYGSVGGLKSPTQPKGSLVAPSPLDCTPHPMFHSAMGDVDIIVETTLFKVHSSVLMMNSRRLADLITALKPKLPDGSADMSEPMTQPLFLPDETSARFSTLLRWMYPGSSPTKGKSSSEQPQITTHNALDLMALSVKYEIPKLTRECEEFLRGVRPEQVINSTNLEDCFTRSAEYRKKGMVRLLDMCFQFLHDKVSDFTYDGDFVTMLLLAERYRLPTVRYQAWSRVVSTLPSIQHTPSFYRVPEETRRIMKDLRYNLMCAFETVGRLVLRLYPVDCGCRSRALGDWLEKVEWAWFDGWKWDSEGTMRMSFAVPSLGTCEEHEEESLMWQVEIQQCWVGEQEIYDGFEVQLEVIEPGESLHGSLESLRMTDDNVSEQS